MRRLYQRFDFLNLEHHTTTEITPRCARPLPHGPAPKSHPRWSLYHEPNIETGRLRSTNHVRCEWVILTLPLGPCGQEKRSVLDARMWKITRLESLSSTFHFIFCVS